MRGCRLALAAAVCIAVSASAAGPADLRSLFPSEADVHAQGSGLARLELPPEVLAACRPDLSNVRLFDLRGNEIPFLLDAQRRTSVRHEESVPASPLEVRREEEPRQGAPSLRREVYEVATPDRAPRQGSWRLLFDSVPDTFVAQVEVRAAGGSAPETTRGSIFRLASPMVREKLWVLLPPGPMGRLEIRVEHAQSTWLQPSLRFESAGSAESGTRATIPLEVLSRGSAGGKTVLELARPRGVVPEALRLETATPTFDRRITVEDQGPGHDAEPLAAGGLFRLSPGTGIEELEIPLRAARGDRLRVLVEDGDSPPLDAPAFAAVVVRPSLVASLVGQGGSAPAAVLRFGGSRARVPRYDLAGLHPGPGKEVHGRRAEALVRLYDPAAVQSARLGPIRPNPLFDPSPMLDFAMRAGSPIDLRAWAMRRSLHVQDPREGLTRVRLGPDDLARLLADLGDLRIVDQDGRQWPYLLDHDAGASDVPCTVAAVASKEGTTTYRIAPEAGPLSLDGLRLHVDSPFFDRAFRLRAETDGQRTVLVTQGRLSRPAGDPLPVLLELPRTRVRSLELEVVDGDDAPLSIPSARAQTRVPDVFLAAPTGRYWVLLGSPEATLPRYELERVREVVLALDAEAGELGPLEENPRYSAAARFLRGRGREQALLWAAIVAAVVVLGALTLRLARRERA